MTEQRRPRPKSMDGTLPVKQRRRSVYLAQDKNLKQKSSHEPLITFDKRGMSNVAINKPSRARASFEQGNSVASENDTRSVLKSLRHISAVAMLGLSQANDTELVVRLPRARSLRANLLSLLQYIAVSAIALTAAYSTGIGQWFVLIYAIAVIVLRRNSSLSFGIALFILVSIPIFQLLNQPGVANNMAVYVYELLVVGTIQAIIELKWPLKQKT